MTMHATDAPSYSDDLDEFLANATPDERVRLELAGIAHDVADTLYGLLATRKEAEFFYITRHERYQTFAYTDYLLALLRELNVEATATEYAPGREYWKITAQLVDPVLDEDLPRYE